MTINQGAQRDLYPQRILSVLACSLLYGLLILWLSTGSGHSSSGDRIVFAALQSLLLIACFQWWMRPIAGRHHDYLCPLTLVSVWTFVFFGPGSVPAYVERSFQLGLGNPGAVEHFPHVLVPVVAGAFVWDWSYRAVHRCFVRPSSSSLNVRLTPEVKALLVFWVGVSLVVYTYLTSNYTQLGLGFAPTGNRVAGSLGGDLDTALNQIFAKIVLFSWALSVYVALVARDRTWRWAGIAGVAAMGLLLMSTLSRRRLLIAGLALLGLYLYLHRPTGRRARRILVLTGIAVLMGGVLVTGLRVIRTVGSQGGSLKSTTPASLLAASQRVEFGDPRVLDAGEKITRYSLTHRLAGLDLLAGARAAREELGVSSIGGRHNSLAALQAVPRAVWPAKPDVSPKRLAREHYSLPDLDHLNTVVSSAYLDWGATGVVLGFVAFALLMGAVEAFIWRLDYAPILYFGTLIFPANVESYVVLQPLLWLRFVVLVGLISLLVLAGVRALSAGPIGKPG